MQAVSARKSTSGILRVLIADDHFVVRQGLKLVLRERFESVEFGEASNGNEAIQMVWDAHWDTVLLDISMPGRGGVDALREIKRTHPALPVIVLSMHPEEQFAVRVLKQGACAYIQKDCAGRELVLAIDAALAGQRYITPSLANKLAGFLQENRNSLPHESLADREYQVLCLLGSGKTGKEVADQLSLSAKTISTYRIRLLKKTGLKNNAQIMQYVVTHNLSGDTVRE